MLYSRPVSPRLLFRPAHVRFMPTDFLHLSCCKGRATETKTGDKNKMDMVLTFFLYLLLSFQYYRAAAQQWMLTHLPTCCPMPAHPLAHFSITMLSYLARRKRYLIVGSRCATTAGCAYCFFLSVLPGGAALKRSRRWRDSDDLEMRQST